MWGTLQVFIHLNMSRNKAFAWSDNDAPLSCDRLVQIVILNHSLLFSWMCWSLPWLHLLHYILVRGYTDSLQQENGIEQRELLTEFPWNVLIWLKHMVESGNYLSISLIFKNCSYLCSPVRWWGNHSAGESSELLSGHTTDRINSVDFFFLVLLSLDCIKGGVFFHLCTCLCDSFLDANTTMPLHLSGTEFLLTTMSRQKAGIAEVLSES